MDQSGQMGRPDLFQDLLGQTTTLDGQDTQPIMAQLAKAQPPDTSNPDTLQTRIGRQQGIDIPLVDPGNLTFFNGDVAQEYGTQGRQAIAGGCQGLDNFLIAGSSLEHLLIVPGADDQGGCL